MSEIPQDSEEDSKYFDDNHFFEFSDELDTNVKIRPNYYVHTAIIMAQKSLMFSIFKNAVADGLLTYSIFVEHIEVLCKAAEYVEAENYNMEIKKFLDSDEYKKIERKDVQLSKLANKKLELLLYEVFKGAPIDAPLRYRWKNLKKPTDEKMSIPASETQGVIKETLNNATPENKP